MSGLTNLETNNGITERSELIFGKITLMGTDDAIDFNSGTLKLTGGMSVQKKSYLQGDLTLGSQIFINNNQAILMKDTAGSDSYMTVQNDNNFVHYSTDATGANVPTWGIPQRNSNSAFYTVYPIVSLNGADAVNSNSGSINAFGGISSRETVDATSSISGNGLTIAGGGAIGKKLYVGSSLILDGTGTSSFVRFPRLTTTQRNALVSLIGGEQIFNTTTSQMNYYDGSVWQVI